MKAYKEYILENFPSVQAQRMIANPDCEALWLLLYPKLESTTEDREKLKIDLVKQGVSYGSNCETYETKIKSLEQKFQTAVTGLVQVWDLQNMIKKVVSYVPSNIPYVFERDVNKWPTIMAMESALKALGINKKV